jgi:Aromatic ring hydroxylase
MVLRKMEEYLNSLRENDKHKEVYYRGKKIRSFLEHPTLNIAAKHTAKLFEFPDRGYYDETMNEEISKYFKVPRNSDDLLNRHTLIYNNTVFCKGVFNISQAIGSDALFSLMIVSKIVDRKLNTNYYEKVQNFYKYVAKNDLTLAVAQTDVKGDRSKRPSEQDDPYLYLKVSEVKKDGIVVNGAKAHTTQSAVAEELIVLPTRAMKEGEELYSVAFSIPTNTKGLKFIIRPIEELEGNTSSIISKEDYEFETLTIFENVFVPWERVFLFKEYNFSGYLANLFATFHRFTAISYRSALTDLYLGTTSLLAKANGIENEKHVRDDILNIILYKEIMRMSAIVSALKNNYQENIAIPNPIYTNIGKLYSNENFIKVVASLIDVAGGIIATLPSEEDLNNDELKAYMEKFLKGKYSGKERIKLLKLAKELASSSFTGYLLTLMLHAEGSMEASKIGLIREYNLKDVETFVENILK